MVRRPNVTSVTSVPPPSLTGDKVQQQQALESLLREIEQRVQLECNLGSYFVQHSYSTVASHDVLIYFVFDSFVCTNH